MQQTHDEKIPAVGYYTVKQTGHKKGFQRFNPTTPKVQLHPGGLSSINKSMNDLLNSSQQGNQNLRHDIRSRRVHRLAPLPTQTTQSHKGLSPIDNLSVSTPNIHLQSSTDLHPGKHWNTPANTSFFRTNTIRKRRQASIIMEKATEASPFKNKFHPDRSHPDGTRAVPLQVDHILNTPYNSTNHFVSPRDDGYLEGSNGEVKIIDGDLYLQGMAPALVRPGNAKRPDHMSDFHSLLYDPLQDNALNDPAVISYKHGVAKKGVKENVVPADSRDVSSLSRQEMSLLISKYEQLYCTCDVHQNGYSEDPKRSSTSPLKGDNSKQSRKPSKTEISPDTSKRSVATQYRPLSSNSSSDSQIIICPICNKPRKPVGRHGGVSGNIRTKRIKQFLEEGKYLDSKKAAVNEKLSQSGKLKRRRKKGQEDGEENSDSEVNSDGVGSDSDSDSESYGSADTRTRKLRKKQKAELKRRQEMLEKEGRKKEKTLVMTRKNANLFYVDPSSKYPPELTDATGCIFPDGVKDAFQRALHAAELKRLPKDPEEYNTRFTRPFVFSYFKNIPYKNQMNLLSQETREFYSDKPTDVPPGEEETLESKPAAETETRKKKSKKKGKKKKTEMQRIFGDLNINDFYPGMKYNRFPKNVKYLPGFGPGQSKPPPDYSVK